MSETPVETLDAAILKLLQALNDIFPDMSAIESFHKAYKKHLNETNIILDKEDFLNLLKDFFKLLTVNRKELAEALNSKQHSDVAVDKALGVFGVMEGIITELKDIPSKGGKKKNENNYGMMKRMAIDVRDSMQIAADKMLEYRKEDNQPSYSPKNHLEY